MSKLNVIKSVENARNYEVLKLDVIRFEAEDVVTVSPPGEQWPGEDWGQ